MDIFNPDGNYNQEKLKQVNRLRALHAFVQAAYSEILKFNNDIFKEDGSNVDLYIAAPTKWSDEEKFDYKTFIETALGRKIGWIINESDAAFFSKRDADCKRVLVIDYGSSTIDYTLVIDNKKVNLDDSSNNLGAQAIENTIFDVYRKTDDYKENYAKAVSALQEIGCTHVNVDSFIKFQIRKAKEVSYTNSQPYLDFSFQLRHIFPQCKPVEFHQDLFDFETLFEDYKKSVIDNFKQLKTRIYGILKDDKLDKIILSGGASIMPWVKEGIASIWGNDIKLVIDSAPSYVVSNGIVKYALAQEKCKIKIREYLDKVDLMSIYTECDESATHESIEKFLPPVLNDYVNDPNPLTANDLLDRMINFFQKQPKDSAYQGFFRNSITIKLQGEIDAILRDSLKNVFGYELPAGEKIEIFLPEVPLTVYKIETMTSVVLMWMQDAVHGKINMSKERKKVETWKKGSRKDLADACLTNAKQLQISYEDTTFVDQLKQMIYDKTIEIFNKKQLFKTISD